MVKLELRDFIEILKYVWAFKINYSVHNKDGRLAAGLLSTEPGRLATVLLSIGPGRLKDELNLPVPVV